MNISQHKSLFPKVASILAFSALAFMFVAFAGTNANLLAQQQAQFGKIKPQYQSFTWNFLQSRSFDIYYHDGGEYLAQYAGITLEEGAKATQRILGFSWNERLPVMIYNSPNEAQQTNAQEGLLERGAGNINELRKNRMVVAFRGDWDVFRLALRKELAFSMVNLLYYGVNLPSPINGQFDLPVWFSEGLAEYISHEGVSTETDMFARDMVVSEQFTSMNALEGYARVKMGQMMFAYIAEKFGASKISELITRARGMGTVEGAFRATFGVNVDGFTTLWKRELREQYAPDVTRYEDIEKIAQQRLADAAKDGAPTFAVLNAAPVFSPNGDRLAYLSARDGAWAVYLQDMRAKKTDNLIRLAATGRVLDTKITSFDGLSLGWKPETGGKGEAAQAQIVYITQSGGSDGIAMVNVQSGTVTRFETISYKNIRSLAVAPDGKTIAFAAVENELPNLYLYDIATKKTSKLTNDVFSENLPTFAADGKTLFFISDRAGILTTNVSSATYSIWEHDSRSSDVYAMNLATKKIERVTTDSYARKTGLAVSQDGKKLLIVSDRSGIANLYEWNIQAKTFVPKTNLLTGIGTIGLQRDAARAAVTTVRKGSAGLFLLATPFDRKSNNPDPTELRKQAMEREAVAEKALGRSKDAPSQPVGANGANAADTSIVAGVSPTKETKETTSETPSPASYGKYDIDLSKQKMVEPNPDVAARAASELVSEQNDYTKPGKLPSLPLQYGLEFDSYSFVPSFDTFFGQQPTNESQSFLGNFGGSGQAIWQDIMGNNRLQVFANVMFSFANHDLGVTYSYLPELIDYEASLFLTSRLLFVFDAQTRNAILTSLTYWGASGKAMMPLAPGMRLEGKVSVMNTRRESRDPSFASVFNRSELLIVPEARFVLDNTETGFFGSISGAKAQAKVDGVPGLAGMTFARAVGDYRQYVPIKNFAVIAGRLSVGTTIGASVGTSAPSFFMGGQENLILGRTFADDLPFSRAEDLYFTYLASPLRGFPIFASTGRNFFAANVEARVNLMQPDGSNSMLSNILNGLQGVVFVDAGSAWTNSLRLALATQKFDAFGNPAGFENGDLLMSFGFGVRTYLLGQWPVKIDLAFQNLQTGIGRPSLLIGFGYNF